jgi:hypothetical protein
LLFGGREIFSDRPGSNRIETSQGPCCYVLKDHQECRCRQRSPLKLNINYGRIGQRIRKSTPYMRAKRWGRGQLLVRPPSSASWNPGSRRRYFVSCVQACKRRHRRIDRRRCWSLACCVSLIPSRSNRVELLAQRARKSAITDSCARRRIAKSAGGSALGPRNCCGLCRATPVSVAPSPAWSKAWHKDSI